MANKSLGTLTLDLIAKVGAFEAGMDKASRKTKTTAREIERNVNLIAKTIAGMGVAAGGGLVRLTTSLAESSREIENFAALADTSTQQFQRITYAAQRYGIEQDKIADILKDTNDRVGDFIQTGGGPMADFFENIAPLVGVTADEFQRLSGPAALQLYVDSLEKANVSQKDMTFYMEALASDATLLLPLLRDNGAEMARLGDEAERTGNVFSDLEFEQLREITRSTDQLLASFTGMKNEVVLGALPAVNDLIDLLGDQGTIDAAQSLGNAVVTSVSAAVKTIKGAVEITQFLAEELAALTNGAAADDIVRLEDQLQTLQDMVENPTLRLRFFGKDGLVEYYDEQELQQEIASIEAQLEAARSNQALLSGRSIPEIETGSTTSITAPDGSSAGISRTGKAARDAAEAVADLEEALADMRAEYDPAMAEFDRYADRIDLIEQFNITAREKDKLREEAFAEHQERMAEIAQEGEQSRGAAMLEASDSYWAQWIAAAEDNLQNFGDLSQTVIDNFTTQFGDAFESVILDSEDFEDALKGIADTILRSVVNSVGQLIAQWAALQAVQAALGSTTTATSVAEAGLVSAAWAPAAAFASLATLGGNAAPATAALTATTALSSGLALAGMAHDGIDSIPEDGTWFLKKGERVTTEETSAKLDRTLDHVARSGGGGSNEPPIINIIEDAARSGTSDAQQDRDGRWVIDVIVADALTDGRAAKTYQRTFGLTRQG